ncbi:hypothetical protein HYH03_012825 [Edaphochlamys debaryana]|uniref:Pre-rRNA-processing protein RIX1 N-terminal domain-containing protein n=1 Tax=Edaphochlamys debaryana TaxID=47281 RepID=A0A835XTE1_9CHLO|nr:hypothetical protein HYH03_012825 [Edaphochlamys debaryana]|eukprot:KAG2488663.1 hypothetical protein HYH03_012825 [Edaphochlamys debaryana]
MEAAAALRSTLLRNVLSAVEQPLDPDRTAAIASLLVGSGLLSAGPDGAQGGLWTPVTELQAKLVEQLLKHLGSKGESACRPGAAVLLGVVCCHCPACVFLAGHGEWASALLDAGKKDADAMASRAAVLHALAQLFTRVQQLLEVPGVRRDASGPAGRTLALATPLFTNPGCRAAALSAARAVLTSLPAVARNHAASLEAAAAALIAAPDVPPPQRSDAARLVALLPRASATEAAAWSTACRRLLLSLHTALDLLGALGGGGGGGEGTGMGGGAGDAGLAARAREQLGIAAGAGAEAEGLLAAAGFGGSGAAAARTDATHVIQVTLALLDGLAALLSGEAGAPVPLPAHAVLLAVMRLSKLEPAALLAPGRTAPSASAQAAVLAALPGLQRCGWGLLALLVRVGRGALMPLGALVSRVLSEQLRRVKAGGAGGLACAMPPSVRAALYDATSAVLQYGGMAAGRSLAVEVSGALVTELYGLSAVQQQAAQQAALYGTGLGGKAGGGGGRSAGMLGGHPPGKKAKGGADPLAGIDLAAAAAVAAAAAPVMTPDDAAAQVAALGLAAALLAAAGPALTSDVRGQIDALCYHVAAVTSEAALKAAAEPNGPAAARAATLAALRVAAARALAASLAAPWPSRHPFLPEGLALLRAGAAGGGAAPGGGLEFAHACSEGLAALEPLLRPRSAAAAAGAGGDARQGGGGGGSMELGRPRLWSILDPVQPQLPPPAAAPAVVAAAEPAAAAAQPAPAKASGKKGAKAEAAATPAAAAAKGNGAAAGKGAAAAVASAGKAGAAAKDGAGAAGKKGNGKGRDAAEPPAMETRGGKRQKTADAKAKAAEGAAAAPAPAPTPAAAAAAPAPAPAVAAAAAAAPAPQRAAAAAAVFGGGDESEDSEGSLPDIDSGDDSGSEDA